MTQPKLSPLAEKLLAYLQQTGGAWEGYCLDYLFDKPEYGTDLQSKQNYWQWQANAYSTTNCIPSNYEISPTVERSFSKQISDAYQELKAAGLANEHNNGYNDYYFYPVN